MSNRTMEILAGFILVIILWILLPFFNRDKPTQGSGKKGGEKDPFLEQLPKLKLKLDVDEAQPAKNGFLNLVLTLVNGTDQLISPAMLIMMARHRAWSLYDPRMCMARFVI